MAPKVVRPNEKKISKMDVPRSRRLYVIFVPFGDRRMMIMRAINAATETMVEEDLMMDIFLFKPY